MSFFSNFLSAAESEALGLSLRVAGVAVVVALPLAVLVATVLARKRFFGRGFLNVLTLLPLVVPPVVTGYSLLLVFGHNGPLGQFFRTCCGLEFSFRWIGAALAAGVMSFPLMVRSIRLSLEAIDRRYEDAAATLGARPVVVFVCVTLPLALPGIIAAAVLGFAKALGEFGATISFVASIPGETQTLSLALYAQLQVPDGEAQAQRLMVISLVLAVAAVALSEWLLGRSVRRA